MFGMSKSSSPKVFVITPAYARGVIEKSINDSNAMIAVAESFLAEDRTQKQKQQIDKYIKSERIGARLRGEVLALLGTEPIACNIEELIEFNSAFPGTKPGIDARSAFKAALSDADED